MTYMKSLQDIFVEALIGSKIKKEYELDMAIYKEMVKSLSGALDRNIRKYGAKEKASEEYDKHLSDVNNLIRLYACCLNDCSNRPLKLEFLSSIKEIQDISFRAATGDATEDDMKSCKYMHEFIDALKEVFGENTLNSLDKYQGCLNEALVGNKVDKTKQEDGVYSPKIAKIFYQRIKTVSTYKTLYNKQDIESDIYYLLKLYCDCVMGRGDLHDLTRNRRVYELSKLIMAKTVSLEDIKLCNHFEEFIEGLKKFDPTIDLSRYSDYITEALINNKITKEKDLDKKIVKCFIEQLKLQRTYITKSYMSIYLKNIQNKVDSILQSYQWCLANSIALGDEINNIPDDVYIRMRETLAEEDDLKYAKYLPELLEAYRQVYKKVDFDFSKFEGINEALVSNKLSNDVDKKCVDILQAKIDKYINNGVKIDRSFSIIRYFERLDYDINLFFRMFNRFIFAKDCNCDKIDEFRQIYTSDSTFANVYDEVYNDACHDQLKDTSELKKIPCMKEFIVALKNLYPKLHWEV